MNIATKPIHTSGPWTIAPRDTGRRLIDGEGHSVCVATRRVPQAESIANVHLIAAAPEMLEALLEADAAIRAVNEAAGHPVFNPAATDLIRAAIAKATGEAL